MSAKYGATSLATKQRSTGPQAPHRTTPHVFSRADGNWWLIGKVAGRRLDHREYLQGRVSWDRFFDVVHASDGGTVQWYTAIAGMTGIKATGRGPHLTSIVPNHEPITEFDPRARTIGIISCVLLGIAFAVILRAFA